MMSTIVNDTAVSSAGLTLVSQQQQLHQQQSSQVQQQQPAVLTTLMSSSPQQQHQMQQQQMHVNNSNTVKNQMSHQHQHQQQQQQQAVPAPAAVVLSKQRLHELVQEIDPCEQLDEEVEDALLHMADDFIDQTVTAACQMARHRDSRTLEVRDVQLVLEKEWNISIPGFGHPLSHLNRFKSHSATTEAHKQRLALIKKTLKKM